MKKLYILISCIIIFICVNTRSSPQIIKNINYSDIILNNSSIENTEHNFINICSKDSYSTELICPHNMIKISGNYCPQVEQICLKWDESVVNVNGKVRCLEFKNPSKCLSKNRINLNFCIDTFEYPNILGEIPEVMVSWNDMKRNCENIGKRLCKDYEWEFACEGEEMLPYPYGYIRNFKDCNIDKPWIKFDENKLYNPKTRKAEVDRLSQREPSRNVLNCLSPWGVAQMAENVDEFVINSSGQPYKSALKGGHWTLGTRSRCRPATLIHNENFAFYAEGGRCCKNIK